MNLEDLLKKKAAYENSLENNIGHEPSIRFLLKKIDKKLCVQIEHT